MLELNKMDVSSINRVNAESTYYCFFVIVETEEKLIMKESFFFYTRK